MGHHTGGYSTWEKWFQFREDFINDYNESRAIGQRKLEQVPLPQELEELANPAKGLDNAN